MPSFTLIKSTTCDLEMQKKLPNSTFLKRKSAHRLLIGFENIKACVVRRQAGVVQGVLCTLHSANFSQEDQV